MKGIKYIAAVLLSVSMETGLFAKMVIIDRSEKVQPEWLIGSQTKYLVTQGRGTTIDNAKNNAQNSLKSMVFTMVLSQMKTKNAYFKRVHIENEEAKKLLEKSAFYSGFDAANHSNFYWERLKDKETKSKTFHYYLQHSINEDEMDRAIDEIAADHELSATLDSISIQLAGNRDVRDLHAINTKLMFLNPRFSDNDKRKAACEELLSKVEEKYNGIEIKEMLNIPGKLVVCQTAGNKAVYTSEPPLVKSKCAMITKIENYEEQWIIRYKYFSLGNPSADVITVEFDNIRNKISKDFKIDMNEEKVDVRLSGSSIVVKGNQMIKFNVISSYRGDAVAERIILRYNDLNFTDTRLNQLLNGAGFYTIRYLTPPGFHKIKADDKVSGELHIISKKTGQKEIFRFYNQKLEML